MLDLKELEKKLDNALQNETSASLTAWLLSQRMPYFQDFLGEGQFVQLMQMNCAVHNSIESYVGSVYENGVGSGENSFAMAA